ncbi:glycoside hydrolase family 3 protein [Flagellimonas sp. HMM57]|uniref:glycoside hydrolase family 3 protein n=1 Tax=unclassified Flagellimonas TaxID=2644544 RepID=UPI0013D26FA8|nr:MULTISPECIES: glycoside hydrolase family 3 protein [unclassified Flagellimonas]UII75303.1 glycoside hydrolase family 3 protein [Flagellimonas sp. HMM57]
MLNRLPSYKEAKEKLTPKQKVGQLFMPAVFINDSEEEINSIENLIRTDNIGAICFFHSRASAATNFEGKKKVVYNENSYDRLKQLIDRYQKAAKFPLLVAIDAEWGLAMRIENTNQFPYAITLGAIQGDNQLIYEIGRQIALDCMEAGVHWNLAPVVDINNNPKNPVIGYRSFGDDKKEVLAKAEVYINGMNSIGTLNAIKHFPGHGDTDTDSHLGLPIINKTKEDLFENELYPYKQLVHKNVDAVMVGHLSVPGLDDSGNPSTTSSKIITDVLRTALGFEGVIISDALNMHAVSKKYNQKGELEAKAFEAGMDMMCFSENSVEGIAKITATATEKNIEESFERVWKLKEKIFLKSNQEKHTLEQSASELNENIARRSITELYGNPRDIESIKQKNFLNLSLDNLSENHFSSKIQKEYGQTHHCLKLATIVEIKKKISGYQHIVLALFPPSIKPKNKFGITEEVLTVIIEMISEKNVLIYLFGNPYVLDILKLKPNSNAVVVYQDFPEFQQEAFRHFSGELNAVGKLPVTLKTFDV